MPKIDEDHADQMFTEFLLENYPPYEIGGLEFQPNVILQTDEIAYREAFLEFVEMLIEDGYEVEGY